MRVPEVQQPLGAVKESLSAARFALRGGKHNAEYALGSLEAAERALGIAIDRLRRRMAADADTSDGAE